MSFQLSDHPLRAVGAAAGLTFVLLLAVVFASSAGWPLRAVGDGAASTAANLGVWLLLLLPLGLILALWHTTRRLRDKVRQAAVLSGRQNVLVEFAQETNLIADQQQVLTVLAEHITRHIPHADAASVILWDADSQQFTASFTNVPGETLTYVTERVRRSGGATRWIVDHARTLMVPDVADDPFGASRMLTERGLQAYLGVPIISGATVFGVAYALSRTPHHYSEGDIDFMQSLAHDAAFPISRTRLQQEINTVHADLLQAHRLLQRADFIKTKFISDIMHELRTPVTGLQLYLDLIQRGRPENLERYLGVLREHTARLAQLVRSSHNLESIGVDQSAVHVDNAFNQMVLEVIEPYRARLADSPVQLDVALGDGLPPVPGVAHQLQLAVDAVINNAVLYTEAGHVQVSTAVCADRSAVVLQVSDTGIGIDESELELVFEPFYRGQDVAGLSRAGLGIGLTVARDIVQRHGGALTLKSRPGAGTTVQMTLPLAAS